MFEQIRRFSELSGPSGQEGPVLTEIERQWREAEVRIERTKTGSLIGRIGGSGRKVLLVAHADELCYLVRSIDAHGFLWLANGQAWSRTVGSRNWFTVGQPVRVLARTGELPGVIASVTGHVASLRLPDSHDFDWDDLWVDTGLTAQELRERGVTPGTRVIWDATCRQLGAHIVGKALDDRVGVAILGEIARQLDGAALMRADVPTALLAFPTRYTHTPFEMGHLADVKALTDLLCAFARSPL